MLSTRLLVGAALLAGTATPALAQFTVGTNRANRSGTTYTAVNNGTANAAGAATAANKWRTANAPYVLGAIDLFSSPSATPCGADNPVGYIANDVPCRVAPSNVVVGNGITMNVERRQPAFNWGPVVTQQGFTYTDPGTTSPVRVDVEQGHYAVNAAGQQDPNGAYIRMTSLPNGTPAGNTLGTTVGALTFSQAINGFGFYLIDTNQPNSTLTIRYFLGNSDALFTCELTSAQVCGTTRPAAAGDGNLAFVGYYGDAFDRIEFTTSNASPGGSLDGWALSHAQAIVTPEPGTYALMATGLAALGAVARRRRRVQA